MKRYQINPEKREFKWGKMDVVVLGEEGRGRKLSLIPYHAPIDAQYLAISSTRTGKPKIIQSHSSKNWLAFITTKGVYRRNTQGYIKIPFNHLANIKLIANGKGAWGDAGRLGEYWEYLLEVRDNTWIYVRVAGKGKDYWLYFAESEVFRVEEEELDAFLERYPEITNPREWLLVKFIHSPANYTFQAHKLWPYHIFDVKVPDSETTQIEYYKFDELVEKYFQSLKKEEKKYCDGDFCFSYQGNIIRYKGEIYVACNPEDYDSERYTYAIKVKGNIPFCC